jgi:superfamily II DNA or RNA helicase
VADQFNAAGYRAATIDGTMDREARREVVRALGDGRLHVLTSCEIINEGFDLPLVTAAILLRPTKSLGLHLQQIGRVLRPAPGKTKAIILDHVGNLSRHGFAEDVRDWTLEGRKKKKRKASDEEEIQQRQCPDCYCCHPPAPVCPECGYEYPRKEREIEQAEGELVQIDPKEIARQKRQEQGSAQTLEDLIALGRARGYRSPDVWAKHVWNSRKGVRV